jgi:uncharacterized repeat protein (TIGR01451 family)
VTAPDAAPANTGPRKLPVAQDSSLGLSLTSNPQGPRPGYDTTYTAVITNGGPTDVENADLTVTVPQGYTGQWTCVATAGSGCPGSLGAGALHTQFYVASGGTVTLTATGQAEGGAVASVPEVATLYPPASYADLYCSQAQPCTVTGAGVDGEAAAAAATQPTSTTGSTTTAGSAAQSAADQSGSAATPAEATRIVHPARVAQVTRATRAAKASG